jgi:phosphoglycolate phosphatase
MRPVRLLIFDLDGTLVNTIEDITESVNFTLGRLGSPPLPGERVRRYVGDGIEELMKRSLGGTTERVADAVAIYKEHHRRNLMVRSRVYPGVLETLDYFKPLPMSIISNKTMEFVESLINRLGIAAYFNPVIGADLGLPLKPAPDAVLKILSDSGVPRERAVMVGDGTTDIRAGKAAGVMTCAVTYGFRSEDELRKAGPDYVIHAFSELKELFMPGNH